MNNYYLTMVLDPNLEEKARQELLMQVKKKVTGENGKVEKEDLWGERSLSYPIKKQTKGFYVHLEFSADPKIITNLDKNLKVEENVLRYLLIRQ